MGCRIQRQRRGTSAGAAGTGRRRRSYRALIAAGLARDRDRIREIAVATGFVGAAMAEAHRPELDRIIRAIDDAMSRPSPFDFGDRAFVPVIREEGPDVPFSIFVGVHPEPVPRERVRMAEGVLHEAMHLLLSLVEDVVPLVAGSGELRHSPWQGRPRPAQGILHGL